MGKKKGTATACIGNIDTSVMIDDFGDTLQEIYDELVKAEASYEDTDDDIRQDYKMALDN